MHGLKGRRGNHYKHGMSGSRCYKVWKAMMAKCYSPHSAGFSRHGARGILVQESWHDFQQFYADVGNPPEGLIFDRKDRSRPYSSDNVRWLTRAEKSQRRRGLRKLTFLKKSLCISEWARELNVAASLIYSRVNRGWPPEDALSIPPGKRRSL